VRNNEIEEGNSSTFIPEHFSVRLWMLWFFEWAESRSNSIIPSWQIFCERPETLTYEDFYFSHPLVHPARHLLACCPDHALSFSACMACSSSLQNRWVKH
jgi:hypothetical protein